MTTVTTTSKMIYTCGSDPLRSFLCRTNVASSSSIKQLSQTQKMSILRSQVQRRHSVHVQSVHVSCLRIHTSCMHRQHYLSPDSTTRVHGPSCPSSRAVNSGSGNHASHRKDLLLVCSLQGAVSGLWLG